MIRPIRLAPAPHPGLVLRSCLVLALAAVPSLAARTALAAPGEAALDLPQAGRIADVAQTSFRDGYVQRITYAGGSRSYAEISLRTGGDGGDGGSRFGSAVSIGKPTRLGIAAELSARFPGEVMRVSTVPKRNAYGPVGLALGSDCLYAWQWIDLAPQRGGRMAEGSLFGASTERAASLRIKLCRTASASLADLVGGVERLRLTIGAAERGGAPSLSARPSLRPQRERPSARAASAPAKSPRAETPAPGAMERPVAPDPKGRATRRPSPEAIPSAAALPAPTGPGVAVPLPAGTGAAPRYITDSLPQQNPAAPVVAPQPAPRGSVVDEPLSQDLPLRAYRPPP